MRALHIKPRSRPLSLDVPSLGARAHTYSYSFTNKVLLLLLAWLILLPPGMLLLSFWPYPSAAARNEMGDL